MLAEGYPEDRRRRRPKRGGADARSSRKTFDFGALKPGETVEGIWKLSAVKAGRFTVLYGVDAGLSGKAKAETDTAASSPGGTFKVQITAATPNIEVTDSGEVVEIGKDQGREELRQVAFGA